MPINPICTVFIICINRGRIDTIPLIAPFSFPHTNQLATEEELISFIYLQIDQWTPCYCAPELYNNSSILKNIDNWNTKTTNINTITFSITFKSKYIVFRDTQNKNKNKRKHNLFYNTYNNTEFRYTKKRKIKENRIYSKIPITTPNSDILKTKREIKENIIYSPIPITAYSVK